MKGSIGGIAFIIGSMGVAGAIETDTSIVNSLIFFCVGITLIAWGLYDEKNKTTTDCSDSSINRPKFLH